MPLLKIGDTYLNSDHIVTAYDDGTAIEITTVHGKETYYNYGADALREWLKNNAEELELNDDDEDELTPRFDPGDRVQVVQAIHERDKQYIGKRGVVIGIQPDDDGECLCYEVEFDGLDDLDFVEGQLKLADTVPF